MSRPASRAALLIAVSGFAWAGWLVVFGGFDTEVLGVRLRSNAPLRPFLGACIALLVFHLTGGRVPRLRLPWLTGTRIARVLGPVLHWRPTERVQVASLSLAVAAFGVTYATTVAGGSDSYGYISQADLWLEGNLLIDQPWVEQAEFASRRPAFAPLGYRARNEDFVIVPTYPPGLPLLFAGAKAVAGQEGLFWVVPLLGGVLVLATSGVARRVAPPGAALIAAWLIATCPVMIFMIVSPMSDVAVAALWMSACYLLLRPGLLPSAAAGLVAAVAVLVRPNLAFVAALLAIWPLWRAFRPPARRGRALLDGVAFGLCVSLGAIAVALFNQHLYGSAVESGYGDLSEAFARAHLWPNLVKYTSWLVESQTMAAAAGLVALFLPSRRLWPDADHRRFLLVSASIVASVWFVYCLYIEFDAWWFLRFMLPALPFIAIGSGAVATALWRTGGGATRIAVALAVIFVVLLQIRFAVDSGAHEFWRGERRYVSIGRMVGATTPGDSVIVSMQHSGSIRYYGGRMTLRFDNLHADALDDAVAWMTGRGLAVYLLAEEWEVTMFRERFAGQTTLDRIDTPVIVHRGSGTAMLYDLIHPPTGEPRIVEDAGDGLRSARPAPRPGLVLQ